MTIGEGNIPNPDPSLATNERLENAKAELRREISANHQESKGWVEALQILHEGRIESGMRLLVEKIDGGIRNIGTRLDGNDTALVAALKAQKEEAAKQTENFKEVLGESKKGTEKQIDSLNEKIEDLKKRVFESGGKSQGIGASASMIIAAVAAIAAIVSVFVVMSKSDHVTVQQQPTFEAPRPRPQALRYPHAQALGFGDIPC